MRDVQPRQRVTRVGRTYHGGDLFAVDQFGHVLDRLGRRTGVVAHHADQLAAKHATGLVHILDRQFETMASG